MFPFGGHTDLILTGIGYRLCKFGISSQYMPIFVNLTLTKMAHKTGDATTKMTKFQAFQTEIEDIHNRALAKQRVQGSVAMTKEKENKDPPSKGKVDEHRKVIVLGEPLVKEKENLPSKGKGKAVEHGEVIVLGEHAESTGFSEVEENILVTRRSVSFDRF